MYWWTDELVENRFIRLQKDYCLRRDSTNITIAQYSYDIINLLCKDFIARLVHLSKIREIQSTIRKATFQQACLSLNIINLAIYTRGKSVRLVVSCSSVKRALNQFLSISISILHLAAEEILVFLLGNEFFFYLQCPLPSYVLGGGWQLLFVKSVCVHKYS